MIRPFIAAALSATLLLPACQSGQASRSNRPAAEAPVGAVNPYLWRASLDTLQSLPMVSADPLGGTIIYDWHSFPAAPSERIKATVFILDSRLRADGIKVNVFRQVSEDGVWTDAPVDPDTAIQLENRILDRARLLHSSRMG
jgi:hypothetical protein